MLAEFTIRKASKADIPAIRAMADVVFRKTYASILSPEQMEYMMDWMYSPKSLEQQMDEGHVFFIAEGAGKGSNQHSNISHLFGYVSIQYQGCISEGAGQGAVSDGNSKQQEKPVTSTELFHLQKIYIMPEAQGCGLGRILFNKAAEYAWRHCNCAADSVDGRYNAECKGEECRGEECRGEECRKAIGRIELNVNRSNPAVGFYEKLGMRKLRQVDNPIGNGFYMNDFIMGIDVFEAYLRSFVPQRFLTDEHYRNGHIHILAPKEGTRILGLHTPEMKAIAKEMAKDGSWRAQVQVWKEKLYENDDPRALFHEERMIWGLILNYVKIPLQERLSLIDEFIPCIDNWAICDNFCCNAKWVERNLYTANEKQLWEFICRQMNSREEFRSRVGLILALAHFLDSGILQRTLDKVIARDYKDGDPYYIRMGAAWLFAEALCKDYEAALPYIQQRRLSRWIHNKAIQKARESWRVSEERKQYLNSLKY